MSQFVVAKFTAYNVDSIHSVTRVDRASPTDTRTSLKTVIEFNDGHPPVEIDDVDDIAFEASWHAAGFPPIPQP